MSLTILPFSSVETQTIQFLWSPYLVRGAFQTLVGDGGVGKGYFIVAECVAVSTGKAWPDGTPNTDVPGDVVILEAEDNAGVLRQRLEQAGADLDRVHLVRAEGFSALDIKAHLGELSRHVSALPAAKLVIISPVNSFMPANTNLDKDSSVRLTLDRLAQFAESRDIAVQGLLHVGKGSEGKAGHHRSLGSVAYVNVPRLSLGMVAKPASMPGEATVGQLGGLKFNHGILPPCRAFRITDDGFTLEDETGADMRTLFQQVAYGEHDARKPGRPPNERQRAMDHLRGMLLLGPRPATDVKAAAEQVGLSKNTLERAKKELGILPIFDGGEWIWSLPTTP